MDIDEEESRAFKEFSSGWDEAFIEDERNRLKEIVERRQRDADKCEPHLLAACLDALDRAKADLAGNDKNHPLTNNTSSKSDEMPVTVATPASNAELPTPWLVADPKDPTPEQPWYIPARFFARSLVKSDSTLLLKRTVLAGKVSASLAKVGIFKRGGKNAFSSGTVQKALSNVSLG